MTQDLPKRLRVAALDYGKVIFNTACPSTQAKRTACGQPQGLFADVLATAASALGVELVWTSPSDGLWGSRASNGSWNGIVGMVARGEADVGASLGVTADRSEAVDFGVSVKKEMVALWAARRNRGTIGEITVWLTMDDVPTSINCVVTGG